MGTEPIYMVEDKNKYEKSDRPLTGSCEQIPTLCQFQLSRILVTALIRVYLRPIQGLIYASTRVQGPRPSPSASADTRPLLVFKILIFHWRMGPSLWKLRASSFCISGKERVWHGVVLFVTAFALAIFKILVERKQPMW